MSVKLHLGAFDCSVAGWVNSDITPHLFVAKIPGVAWVLWKLNLIKADRYNHHKNGIFRKLRYVDLTRPLPFRDGSIHAIFSSHVFEHLFMDEVERLVAECFRILEPGGVIRVVVPDLEKVVALFDPEDPRAFMREIYEVSTRSAVKNSHHSGFTGPFLCQLFKQAGYKEVAVLDFGVGQCPDIDLMDNRPGSLFFEATKARE